MVLAAFAREDRERVCGGLSYLCYPKKRKKREREREEKRERKSEADPSSPVPKEGNFSSGTSPFTTVVINILLLLTSGALVGPGGPLVHGALGLDAWCRTPRTRRTIRPLGRYHDEPAVASSAFSSLPP